MQDQPMTDPNQPEVLIAVPSDVEASLIVGALADCGIEATTTGDFTAGFRAEAPGQVQVVVRLADLDRARTELARLKADLQQIDSSDSDFEDAD